MPSRSARATLCQAELARQARCCVSIGGRSRFARDHFESVERPEVVPQRVVDDAVDDVGAAGLFVERTAMQLVEKRGDQRLGVGVVRRIGEVARSGPRACCCARAREIVETLALATRRADCGSRRRIRSRSASVNERFRSRTRWADARVRSIDRSPVSSNSGLAMRAKRPRSREQRREGGQRILLVFRRELLPVKKRGARERVGRLGRSGASSDACSYAARQSAIRDCRPRVERDLGQQRSPPPNRSDAWPTRTPARASSDGRGGEPISGGRRTKTQRGRRHHHRDGDQEQPCAASAHVRIRSHAASAMCGANRSSYSRRPRWPIARARSRSFASSRMRARQSVAVARLDDDIRNHVPG